MDSKKNFDILISSDKKIKKKIDIKNIAELIFKKINNRDENCDIIWSHENEKFLKINLKKLRYIVNCLYKDFEEKKIKPGDTVILADLLVTNVSYMSLVFIALASYGCCVMLPMWVETKEIKNWIDLVKCKAIIHAESEINSLSKHKREKQIMNEIKTAIDETKILSIDIVKDLKISQYVNNTIPNDFDPFKDELVKKICKNTDEFYEFVIYTTSGTSGRSKLVVYDQKAYLKTIESYEATGLYKEGKMLGRTFIDIFPHSVSIRSFINALWTGQPICMLTSDFIKNKPKKILPHIIKMKPEVITLGPSSFGFVMNYLKTFPDIKKQVFSELKTIVSTGSVFSKKISDDWKEQTGITLHNAYGLIESQQITSTLLNDNFNPAEPCFGKPFAGVSLGLNKFDGKTYKLYIKTNFGLKYMIYPIEKRKIYAEEFYDTKDIVRIDEKNDIYFVGRENLDFIKNGYGAKVPLSTMRKYYKKLYSKVEHIQYFAPEIMSLNLGIAALIFIKEKNLKKGRVKDKKIIKKYFKIIKNINKELKTKIEPFEYENRAIVRFLLINSTVPRTRKNTVSKYIIEVEFKEEISDLLKSNKGKKGVKNILNPKARIILFLMKISSLCNNFLGKIILKVITIRNRN